MICKILELFVDPLAAENKYSVLNRGNLQQYFEVQLSQKRKIFAQFFIAFRKFRFNFENLQKKGDSYI